MERFDKMALHFRVLFGLAFALFWLGFGAPVWAQIPPGEDWMTLDTEHFRVTYPADLLPLAQRTAARAEAAWDALALQFVRPPEGKVDLVLTDHADISNGFTRVFPSNRIVVYAPPPVDGFGLPHMDEWLELVVTHELAHVFHEDRVRNLGSLLRKVMGRAPLEWPFFPGSATPGWVVEGIATYWESELTQAGRVRGSFHEMVLRTAILEDSFERIDQTSGDSPVWPGGQRHYIYGSLFLKHLSDRYGPESMGAFVDAVAGQWIPYRLDSAAKGVFGISFSEAWDEWESHLQQRYEILVDSLAAAAPLTSGEALTDGGFYAWSPEPSPLGKGFAFARLDGRSDAQIRFLDPATGQEKKLVRTNNLSQFSWTPSGGVLFSQLEFTDSYRIRGDLFLMGADGEETRVTSGARLDHPDVAPDGRKAIAVQEGQGTNRLVLVGLDDGSVDPLTPFQDQVLWSYPRWSPDGRFIAVSRWRAGAYFDVVVLAPDGELLWELTHDRGIDNAPAWSPDGRWLLWASDRSGIPNLYGVAMDSDTGQPGTMRQITNLVGGGAYPAVDLDSAWIYYSAYHSQGWRVERIPFRPGDWFEPLPPHPSFMTEGDPERFDNRVETRERAYNPLTTLRPTYWAPTYREGDHAGDVEVLKPGFGLFTSGEDLVGRHSYTLSGSFSQGVGAFNGWASYSYGGLENPILSVAAAQSHDASSRLLAGVTEAGDTVPLYLVEKERSLGFGTTFFRKRSRTETALSLAASHIWEDRFLVEEDLEESTRFRLNRPGVRLGEVRGTVTFGNARRYALSLSPEKGVGLSVRGRFRMDLTRADSLRDVAGSDRSFRDLVGQFVAYQSFRGPGFGNHVVGVRAAAGVANGPGADAFHFEVGGASGGGMPVEFLDLGQSLLFPVRGYSTATRFGRYAWTVTAEYRFPLGMLNRGAGLLPLHLDYLSGSLFVDAGNAWGPDGETPGQLNPTRDRLASVGAELVLRTLPLWFQSLDLRFGVARPLVDENQLQTYLRLGLSF
jgi:hypothetical protein